MKRKNAAKNFWTNDGENSPRNVGGKTRGTVKNAKIFHPAREKTSTRTWSPCFKIILTWSNLQPRPPSGYKNHPSFHPYSPPAAPWKWLPYKKGGRHFFSRRARLRDSREMPQLKNINRLLTDSSEKYRNLRRRVSGGGVFMGKTVDNLEDLGGSYPYFFDAINTQSWCYLLKTPNIHNNLIKRVWKFCKCIVGLIFQLAKHHHRNHEVNVVNKKIYAYKEHPSYNVYQF